MRTKPDGCPVVRQEFSQSCDWVVGDAGKNILEPGERIHADALAGSHEAPQHRGCFAAFIAAEEDPVVAANGYATDRTFGGVVVDFEIAVGAISV